MNDQYMQTFYYFLFFIIFLFFWPHLLYVAKFPGQGSNPCHTNDLHHCSDNTRSLTHHATRELQYSFEGENL